MTSDYEANQQAAFELTMKSLEAQLANISTHLTVDSATRLTYVREIKLMADKLRNDVAVGKGSSNQVVSKAMMRLFYAGKRVLYIALAISVYNIATATDKVAASGKELGTNAASIAGGMAGGALAGLACGPGAPICVTVGAFVGGALAAAGVNYFW